jgi:hypothetical protein
MDCTYTTNGVRCPDEATHYCICSWHEHRWELRDTPQPIELINGFALMRPSGKRIKDAQGHDVPEMLAVMHTLSFCLMHAEVELEKRNSHAGAGVAA